MQKWTESVSNGRSISWKLIIDFSIINGRAKLKSKREGPWYLVINWGCEKKENYRHFIENILINKYWGTKTLYSSSPKTYQPHSFMEAQHLCLCIDAGVKIGPSPRLGGRTHRGREIGTPDYTLPRDQQQRRGHNWSLMLALDCEIIHTMVKLQQLFATSFCTEHCSVIT